jgi:uncharacterized protein (UPF0248 family)
MIPIQELINRILWDNDFGRGDFTIGYYDRIEDKIVTVSFQEILFDRGDHFSFQVFGKDAEICSIPFHRVRTVYKNGQLIWERHKE